MAHVLADRVKETTTTTGTGTLTLDGAATGFQTFVAGIGDTNTCCYCISDGTNWEVGIGTVTDAASDTLTRDLVFDNSLGTTTQISFGSGTKDVWCTLPAARTGGWEKLDSKTASASATVEFKNYIDAKYKVYAFVFIGIVLATDSNTLRLRTSTNGGVSYDTTTNDYFYSSTRAPSDTGTATQSNTETAQGIVIANTIGNAAGEHVNGIVYMTNPSDANLTTDFNFRMDIVDTGSSILYQVGAGKRNSVADVDAIEITAGSGNITSGEIIMYGLR